MNRHSGTAMTELAHIQQSVADILTTPLGSRIMRRDYGSLIPELIDAPLTTLTRQRLIAATAQALARWEPRLQIEQVTVHIDNAAITLNIQSRTRTGMPLQVNVDLIRGSAA